MINDPNDANALGIGMVHQHFKLVECFSVLDNIILGVETTKNGFLQKAGARKKVMALSEKIWSGSRAGRKNRGHNCRYAAEDRDS